MHPKTDQAVQLPKTESCWPALSPWSSPGLGGSPTASPSRNICCAFTWWESNCYSLLLCSLHLLCFYLVRIKWTVVSLLLCSTHKRWESNCYSVFVAVQYSQRGCLSIERGLGLYLVEDFPCIHQHLPQVVHVTPENPNQRRIALIW